LKTFLKELNQAQYEAVLNTEGPSLVIAGAGSGKTRVLTFRVAYLLSKGVDPSNIVALTFTNKAANEMKERIDNIVGNNITRYLWMGTFHSIFARILRIESVALGYSSNYSIYDTTDSKSLIKSIIKGLNLDENLYKPGIIQGRISSAKNNLISAEAYYNNPEVAAYDKITRRPRIADIFKIYCSRCKNANAMDFDDLLLNTNILFRDFTDILKKYQKKFHYILVDEYQDTNYSQYLIVKKLSAVHRNVCVVGDDAQSIYSFRGARIENILNFKNDYSDLRLFKLEKNYRSTKTIVSAANSIIARNKEQIHKRIWSDNETGEKIKIIRTLTDTEEGFFVSNSILDTALSAQEQYSEFAILYRTNAQSRIFEEALRKRNIPYKVYGSISFYERKEIKDVLAYLRLTVNQHDNEALKRIINYPARGLGKITMGKLEDQANRTDKSIWEIILELDEENLGFNSGILTRLKSFSDTISDFNMKLESHNAYELAKYILSSTGILKDLYNGYTPEEISKYENLEELLNGIREFTEENEDENIVTLDKYLQNVSLLTDMDNEKNEDKNKVTIMTIHSAKGLEFNNIYIAGVEEDLLPSRLSLDSPKDLEEERRLFYVAVTRARKRVIITYAQSRYKWGTPIDCSPSRFIKDIDEKYVDFVQEKESISKIIEYRGNMRDNNGHKLLSSYLNRDPNNNHINIGKSKFIKLTKTSTFNNSKSENNIKDFKPDNPENIQAGMKVEHQRFGIGKVIHIEGVFPNRKATVFFQESGQKKQLLLKFAKLKIVSSI
jgi:DNA helicase-2/ATP-dependent DNA helicase PcrA